MSDRRPVSTHLNREFLSLVVDDVGQHAVAFVANVGPMVAVFVTQEMQLVHDLHEVDLVLVHVNHSGLALVNHSTEFSVERLQD